MTIKTHAQLNAARAAQSLASLGLLIAFGLWWVLRAPDGVRLTAYFDKTVGVYSGSACGCWAPGRADHRCPAAG